MKWKKKKIGQELKKMYEAPEPVGKKEFLKQFDTCYLSMGQFMWQQFWYIKKWMWFISAGVFLFGAVLSGSLDRETVWVLCALVPYLALTFLAESGKSRAYRMDELEYATRFSLKSLLLARMGALGICHGAILFLLFLCMNTGFLPKPVDLFYVIVPYLLTVCLGLKFLRRFRGKETVYISVGIPVFVSLCMVMINQMFPVIYGIAMVRVWALACVFVIFFTGKEAALLIKETEELAWN
ncbi:MAG: hypothetical protein NC307_14015 [Roseburia sp.]|nr:hypothetical protein [Roseburia sp.]